MSTMVNSYKEAPGVKKLARSLAESSRDDVRDMLSAVTVCLMETLIFALIFSGFISATAYVTHQTNAPWLIIANITIFSLVLPVTVFRNRAHLHWLFKDGDSSVVEHKMRRSAVKRSRQAAKRLGSTVIPVLTEEHITSVERLHKAMTTAAAASPASTKPDARDHKRLTVLLLADLNREPLLLNLIEERGLVTMDDIEASLKEIETNTITPLQDGWL